MNKLIIALLGRAAAILAFFALVLGSLTFAAPAANAAATNKAPTVSKAGTTYKAAAKKPRAKYTCKKTPKSFTKNGVTVLNMKTCFDIRILKKMGCDTEAGKNEQPAPPRDPRSKCKGSLKVDFKLKMKSPKTPAGMMCTEFNMSITITQRMKGYGLSVSIANGRVDTWARTHLTLKDVIKGWIKTSCVMIPETPEEVTPPPNFQEISLINFVTMGNSYTLTVSGTMPEGHTAELFCTALNGGTITSATKRQSITASPFTMTLNYVAPGEIPGALKDASGNVIVPAGHDMVECEITQDDGQTDTIRTVAGPGQFEIRGVPPQSE